MIRHATQTYLDGFNEARADSPGRFLRQLVTETPKGASMRPGPIRPGDKCEGCGQVLDPTASMRPGPIRPGDPQGVGDGDLRKLASMRPGPIRPGDIEAVARIKDNLTPLQ